MAAAVTDTKEHKTQRSCVHNPCFFASRYQGWGGGSRQYSEPAGRRVEDHFD